MIGLDSTAIIDLFKGDEKLKKILDEQKQRMSSTILNYLELFAGLDQKNKKHQQEAQYYREFFKSIQLLPLTLESCEESSQTFWNLKREGKEVPSFDCAIAAIFLKHGITKILTKNTKHFERIKNLEVIGY